MSNSSHRRRFRDDVDASDFRTACEMYQSGDGVSAIGALLHRDPEIIKAWVAGLTRGSRKWRRGTEAERQMARDLAGRTSVVEIAELLGRNPTTIQGWIDDPKMGDRMMDRLQARDKAVLEAKRLHDEEGLSWRRIAERMGVSESTVCRYMRRADEM